MAEFEMKWDWILVEDHKKKEDYKTEAGLYVQEGMSEDVLRGKVVGVGPGKLIIDTGHIVPPMTQVGALVIYQDTGHRVIHRAKAYRAIKEEDIICEVTE